MVTHGRAPVAAWPRTPASHVAPTHGRGARPVRACLRCSLRGSLRGSLRCAVPVLRPPGGARMSPDELQALIAAAAPGARVTITTVTIEVPNAPGVATGTSAGIAHGPGVASSTPAHPGSSEPEVPKPWSVPPEFAGQAPALLARQTPYTTQELADVLNVQRDTISLWLRKGLLPGASKLAGAGWRIPPSAVLAMLAASVADAAASTAASAAAATAATAAPPSAREARRAALAAERATSRVPIDAAGRTARVESAPAPAATPQADAHAPGAPIAQEGQAEIVGGFDLGSLGDWRQQRQQPEQPRRAS